MADNTSQTVPQDVARANIHEDYEVRYWSKMFGCTAERLKTAVANAGVMAVDVEREMQRR